MAIIASEIRYPSSDKKSIIWARIWQDDSVLPRFVLQIAHGMCEYIDRYAEFAEYICARGGIVCGNDHLGHGNTKGEGGYFGYFADEDGEDRVIDDMYSLTQLMRNTHPNLPYIFFGHSMGSLMGREYAARHGDGLTAAIFTGTSGANKVTGLTRALAKVGFFFGRAKKPAPFLSFLAFSKYNDRVEKKRTEKDWLSRDEAMIDKYLADLWCTFLFTNRAAYDFAKLIDLVSREDWAARLPDIPYYVFSGDMDPVGDYGTGVKQVVGWMQQAGKKVKTKLYSGGRHEILNEINRAEVYEDTVQWIEDVLEDSGKN